MLQAKGHTHQCMQVLYLLEVQDQELKHVATTYRNALVAAVEVSLSGQLILIFWTDYDEDGTWFYDVHARASGDRIATFKPPGVDSPASRAFLPEDRVATATPSSFTVMKLPMGQSQGSHTPPPAPCADGQRAVSFITVNVPATKLAFLPGGCGQVFLYDAHTLALLGAVHCQRSASPVAYFGGCTAGVCPPARGAIGNMSWVCRCSGLSLAAPRAVRF